MKCHCELCGGPAAVYRCIDPVVGVVYTCGGCRFPRMKEFRGVQPPQKLVPAVRVDAAVSGPVQRGGGNATVQRDPDIGSEPTVTEGQRKANRKWITITDPTISLAEPKCRQAYQGRFSLRRMGDR